MEGMKSGISGDDGYSGSGIPGGNVEGIVSGTTSGDRVGGACTEPNQSGNLASSGGFPAVSG